MSLASLAYEQVDALRVPLGRAGAPGDWKEWYHFVLIERASGDRVLANVALSGREGCGQVQGTLLATVGPPAIDHRTETPVRRRSLLRRRDHTYL